MTSIKVQQSNGAESSYGPYTNGEKLAITKDENSLTVLVSDRTGVEKTSWPLTALAWWKVSEEVKP